MSGKSEEIVATLYNMMRLLDDMRYDHNYAFRYIQNPKIENRNYAVNWIKYVSIGSTWFYLVLL